MASTSDNTEPSGGPAINVTVKTLDGQNRTFNVEETMTVKQFKEKISSSIDIPASTQRLIFQGRVMQNEKPLKEYNIHDKVIHVVQRAPPSNLSGPPPDPSPPPPHTHMDPGMFDVQIHMGRPHNVPTVREARARIRQAEFNLSLVNDALNLMEERTNVRTNVEEASEDTEPSPTRQEESMEANSGPERPGQERPGQERPDQERPGENSANNDTAASGLQATELSDFLDRVLRTNSRMTPYIREYRNYLRSEQSYSTGAAEPDVLNQEGLYAQEVVDRVSEALHAMSHVMHSVSDILVDMSLDSPRQCSATPMLGMPGTATMAIPIQMNFRARGRQGSTGHRQQQRQQSSTTATATTTTTSTNAVPTSTAGAMPPSSQSTGADTTSFTIPGLAPGGTAPMHFDVGGGAFQLAPGSDPNMRFEVIPAGVAVHDIRVTHEIPVDEAAPPASGGEQTTSTSTAPTTSSATTTTTSGAPTGTTQAQPPPPQATGPQPRPPGGAATGGTFTFNPSSPGGPNVRMGAMPHIPGLPAGMLQNILGSIISQHGARHGHPVQVNVIHSRGPHPPPPHHHHHHHPPHHHGPPPPPPRASQDLPVDESSPRANASQQTPRSMDASTTTRTNAATNTASGSNLASTNAATNTVNSAGPSTSVGTDADPAMGTNSQSTNTPPGPRGPTLHFHHHRPPAGGPRGPGGPMGGMRHPLGVRPPVPGPRGYSDPFLLCSSLHYQSECARRAMRNAQQAGPAGASQNNGAQGVPNLSTMVSGMVGDMIEQVGNALNTNVRAQAPAPNMAATPQANRQPQTGSTAPPRPAPPLPNANPMQFLGSLLGGVSGGGGVTPPMDIGQLLSGIMGPMLQPGQGLSGPPPTGAAPAGTLAELFTQFRQNTSFGESQEDSNSNLLVGLMECVAPHMHLRDMFSLVMGNPAILGQLRPHLGRYVTEQVAQHGGSLDAVLEETLEDLQLQVEHLQALVQVRPNVDMAGSLRACLRSHLQTILVYLHTGAQDAPDDEYARTVYGMWMRMLAELIALCIYCIQDGQPGFARMLQTYMPRMTEGMNPAMTGWMTTSLQDILASFHRNHPVPQSDIMQYVREPRPKPVASSNDTPAKEKESSSQSTSSQRVQSPMEVEESPSRQPPKAKVPRTAAGSDTDEFVDASDILLTPTPPARVQPPMGTPSRGIVIAPPPPRVPATTGGLANGQRDDWQAVIPQEWIPVIQQDVVRQSHQRPQPPFSDGYIQGLPAKRRRMMSLEHAGEMGNMSGYLPGALSRAARAAGVEPVSSQENMLNEAANETELQDQLEQEVTSVLGSRLSRDSDFNDGERFPYSKEYFHKSRRH